MRYGHFDDAAKEYVIETPLTPLPWINYLGDSDFFGLISNTGGGYDFYRDAKLRRITRYRYNGVPADNGSRCFYIARVGSDGAPGQAWSPTFLPARTALDSYVCRHGLGYSVFEAAKDGVRSELTAFVPRGMNAEVDRLVLTNTTTSTVSLNVTGCVEWCLWNAVDDATNFQRNLSTGEVEVEMDDAMSVIYHKTEYKERRDHYAFFAVNDADQGFETDRDSFLGPMNGWGSPRAVSSGRMGGSIAHGWSPIAAHTVRATLPPGQSTTLVFTLGYVQVDPGEKWEDPKNPDKIGVINKTPAHDLLAAVGDPRHVGDLLEELRDHWGGLLGRFSASTGDPRVDRMANIWNQYQCMVTFNLSRSASYYESGTGRGMGFRDSNQDLLGFVHMVPDRARTRLLDIASTQLPDGSAWHQYQPLTKRGNADIGGGFNDDPLWLVAAAYAYLAETGDWGILSETVPFDSDPNRTSTLLDHLRRSVKYTTSHLGPHGLPLIGRADWNDCLNLNCFSTESGESFQTVTNNDTGVAESVLVAGMFVLYATRYAQILRAYGTKLGMDVHDAQAEAESVEEDVRRMSDAVNDHGWDGQWFLRAYDAYSRPVGTSTDAEGRIYLEPQGMCVMAGIGSDNGRADRALESVRRLLRGPWGSAILAPAYSTYHVELGEISTYPRGYKENGGVFCHINPWITIAEAERGHDEEAFESYRLTSPAFREDETDVRRVEPYVYCQMVAGPESAAPGEGRNSWLTGTAAWSFVALSQHILGVRPTLEGLRIDPHLPEGMDDVRINRVYRGATYHIRIRRIGRRSTSMNGRVLDGHPLPVADAGAQIDVEVTI